MVSIRTIAREAKTNRTEALSDGVFAIVMTLLVIELAVPEAPELFAAEQLHLKLLEMWPKFAAFALSFITLGLFWSFHHRRFQNIKNIDGKVVWLNILILMFVSLIPFSTALMGEYTVFSITAVIFYGANLLLITLSSNILVWYITKNRHLLNKDVSPIEVRQLKINAAVAIILFLIAIGLSFISPYISIAIYILLILWGIIGQLTSKTYHPDGKKNK